MPEAAKDSTAVGLDVLDHDKTGSYNTAYGFATLGTWHRGSWPGMIRDASHHPVPGPRGNSFTNLLHLHPLDLRPQPVQLLVDHLVPAVDMVYPVYLGDPLGLQARQHQRRGRAQIARHHRRAAQ